MEYTKSPISVDEQIEKLERRGLNFSDKNSAAEYLENISYYRLRAFTYPFQNNTDAEADHAFTRNDIDFEDIIDLYIFDRRLRNLIFNELEKIEIAVRTKLSLVYSVTANDSWWFKSKEIYKDQESYAKLMESIKADVKRSNEDFIKHYKKKYSSPEMPPSWMTLEVVSFGTLSHLYEMLKNTKEKRQIARAFGIVTKMSLLTGFMLFRICGIIAHTITGFGTGVSLSAFCCHTIQLNLLLQKAILSS